MTTADPTQKSIEIGCQLRQRRYLDRHRREYARRLRVAEKRCAAAQHWVDQRTLTVNTLSHKTSNVIYGAQNEIRRLRAGAGIVYHDLCRAQKACRLAEDDLARRERQEQDYTRQLLEAPPSAERAAIYHTVQARTQAARDAHRAALEDLAEVEDRRTQLLADAEARLTALLAEREARIQQRQRELDDARARLEAADQDLHLLTSRWAALECVDCALPDAEQRLDRAEQDLALYLSQH